MLSPSGSREAPYSHIDELSLRSGRATEEIEVILAQGSLWQRHILPLVCPEVAAIIRLSDKLADDSPPDRT